MHAHADAFTSIKKIKRNKKGKKETGRPENGSCPIPIPEYVCIIIKENSRLPSQLLEQLTTRPARC